jgi:hypothetical protein
MMHRKLIAFLLCLLAGTGAVALIHLHDKNVGRGGVPSGSSQEYQAPISLSPLETLKAYYKAAYHKNVKEMKRYLSQGTIKLMEKGAERMGKPLDVLLEESAQADRPTATPLFENEKFNGDTATVDITAQGQTVTMPLVKEGVMWKIAIDKFIEEFKANFDEKP